MESKQCSKCGCRKALTEFNYKKKSVGWRRSECKDCQSAFKRQYWNDAEYRARHNQRQAGSRLRNRKIRFDWLTANPCKDCGETDKNVLEFDHLDPAEKHLDVAYMANHGFSVVSLIQELSKCDVVCANCHRRRTNTRMGVDMNEHP